MNFLKIWAPLIIGGLTLLITARQLHMTRAYLVPDRQESAPAVTMLPDRAGVEIRLRNTGTTAITEYAIDGWVFGVGPRAVIGEPSQTKKRVVPPNDTIKEPLRFKDAPHMYEHVIVGQMTMGAVWRVVYYDGGLGRHCDTFAFRYKMKLAKDNPMQKYAEGSFVQIDAPEMCNGENGPLVLSLICIPRVGYNPGRWQEKWEWGEDAKVAPITDYDKNFCSPEE